MPSVLEVLMKRLVKTSKVPAPDVEPEEIASERRLVDSFFQSTTLHGLLQVWSAETKCLKFIFLLSFLICNCAAFYYCYKHIHEYLTDPARASYLIEEAEKLDLPDLTICGFNRFSKERLNAYSISTGLAEYMQWAFIVSAPDYDFINITNQNRKQRRRSHRYEELLNRTLTDHQLTFEQLLRNVSIQCEDLISSCVTNSPRRRYNCCKNATTIMTDSGQCFRIPGITQLGSGYGMGITVLVKIPVHLHTHNNNMANNEGILVKLTEQGKGYDFDAIFVPTGVHALLSLRATLMQLIDDPRQYRCQKNTSATYTAMMCLQHCVMTPMQQVCNCKYIGDGFAEMYASAANGILTDSMNETRVCRPADIIFCGYSQLYNLTETNPLLKNCKAKCLPPCTYWQYQATVSLAKFPSKQLGWRHFKGNSSEEKLHSYQTLRDTELVLEMFHDKLEYVRIKQFESVSIYSMIAYIGGQLGLWMGGSVLSFVHVLVFVCLMFKSKIKGKEKERERFKSHADVTTPLTSSLEFANNNNVVKPKSTSFDKSAKCFEGNRSSPDEFQSSSESWDSMLNVASGKKYA